MKCTHPLPLTCAGTGFVFLFLSLLPVGALTLGSTVAHAAVFLLLLAVAAAALVLVQHYQPTQQVMIALLPIGLSLFLRALMLDFQTHDYYTFLEQWAAAFRDNGGFAAVKLPIGNYNAPYLYFLAAISYLPIPDLYLIKLFSIFFDVILAWGGLRLVRHFTGADSYRPLVCFCLLLLLPTVVLNGACWAQCDSIYGALTLHALASALAGRGRVSCALMGLAFSFKLQTVFILPLWGALFLLGRVRFRQLLWFPGAYALTCLPALLLGKPLKDILGVYLGQATEYSVYLNLNAPNLFAFLPYQAQVDTALASRLGILAAFALVVVVAVLLCLFHCRDNDKALLAAAGVLAIGVPFLLPYMHERYFFLADVIVLCWACISPRRAPVAALVQAGSLGAYLVYLRQKYNLVFHLAGRLFPMLGEALIMLAALVLSLLAFAQLLGRRNSSPSSPMGKKTWKKPQESG